MIEEGGVLRVKTDTDRFRTGLGSMIGKLNLNAHDS